MDATDTIANWIVNTTYEDISPEAIQVGNESCFDVIGVILARSAQSAGEIIKKYLPIKARPPKLLCCPPENKARSPMPLLPTAPWDMPGTSTTSEASVILPSLCSPPCLPSANTPEPRAGTFWKLTWSYVR